VVASLGTAVGSFGVFVIRSLSQRLEDGLLSLAAGIMLAASIFSLLLPAIGYAGEQYGSAELAVLVACAGLFLGAALLWLIHRYVPHEHFSLGREGPDVEGLGRIWLFVIAITLHNFPEGMAVGSGFAGGDVGNGVSLMAGIGLQNIPEGLAVSVALLSVGYGRPQAFLVGAISGLAEPAGGLVGSLSVSLTVALIPWALAFAAGAMLFIISDEIIPETHRGGSGTLPTFSLLGGFALMMYLDAALG
jgi:ZIP family zinc transporter